jgi:hypothetical protein
MSSATWNFLVEVASKGSSPVVGQAMTWESFDVAALREPI